MKWKWTHLSPDISNISPVNFDISLSCIHTRPVSASSLPPTSHYDFVNLHALELPLLFNVGSIKV